MKIALICGGPGAERGISVNSSRSVMDHLQSKSLEIVPFYVDAFMNIYLLSPAQLYSNTPSDFDFKLKDHAQKITKEMFIFELKKVDLVYPLIHGVFGEDGKLQELLESNEIPYVGGPAKAMQLAFPKDIAYSVMSKAGFTVPSFVVVEMDNPDKAEEIIDSYIEKNKLSKVVLKPVLGGSSFGVHFIQTGKEGAEKLREISKKDLCVGSRFIVEPFYQGKEFSVIVLRAENGNVVSFVPTEVVVQNNDGFFDYRAKYLPTDGTRYECPPVSSEFTHLVVRDIQQGAERIFTVFGFNDSLRVDGFLLKNGEIRFTDINPTSGMEQNSFMFEQTSRVGLTHEEVLCLLVNSACKRYGIPCLPEKKNTVEKPKKNVYILMGGKTAERQVALMSGTNVWLKLLQSDTYAPTPFLMDKNDDVWLLPYSFALNHTVEEIYHNCINAERINTELEGYAKEIQEKLGAKHLFDKELNMPQKMTLTDFCALAKQNDAVIFNGLHGGDGENGNIQKIFETYNLVFTGSDSISSAIGMDKYETGIVINKMNDSNIYCLPKAKFNIQTAGEKELEEIWKNITKNSEFDAFAIKPIADGCSSGLIRLDSVEDLKKYAKIVGDVKNEFIPSNTFKKQPTEVALPQDRNPVYLIEPFIPVDYIRVIKNDIIYKKAQGWLELTVGVLECAGTYHSLNPSITIAEGEVLSLEEKFQGGTGVNITPPPENLLSLDYRNKIKSGIEKVAKVIGLKNYARIDVFVNVDTGKMIVIEVNTQPGMTPSTVIYHQALIEEPPLYPKDFVEKILDNALFSFEQRSDGILK